MKFLLGFLIVLPLFAQRVDYRTQVYNKPEISVMDYPYQAKGDGVTNDCAVIQQAHDDLKAAGGGVLAFPMPKGGYVNSAYYMGTDCHLTVDIAYVSFRSYGRVQLDFTQLIAGAAVTVTGTLTPNPTTLSGQVMNYMEGFLIRGPGRNTDTIGLDLNHDWYSGMPNLGPPYFSFRNSQVSEFGICSNMRNNVYLTFYQEITLNTCLIGLNGGASVQHTGENIQFRGGAFVSNTTAIKWDKQSTDLFFYGTSFDFNNARIVDITAGWSYFTNCHFEKNGPLISDHWFNTSGANSGITITDSMFVISGGGQNIASQAHVFNSASVGNRGGIRLFNPNMYFTVNAYHHQFYATGDGPIVVNNYFHYNMGSPTISPKLNLVSNWQFESPQLNEWLLQGTTVADNPVITEEDHHSGDRSVKFATTGEGNFSRMIGRYPMGPGDFIFGTFWYKAQNLGGTGGSFFRLIYQYVGRDGIFIQQNSNQYDVDTPWKLAYTYTFSAPPGTAYIQIVIELVNGTTASTVYLDDLAFNNSGTNLNGLQPGKIPFGCYGITSTPNDCMIGVETYGGENSTTIRVPGGVTNYNPLYRSIGISEFSCIGANCAPTTTLTVEGDGVSKSTRAHVKAGVNQSGPLFTTALNDGTLRFQVNQYGLPFVPVFALGSLPAANLSPGAYITVTGATANTSPCSAGSERRMAISNGTSWECK